MPTASCGGMWGLMFGATDILGRPGDGTSLAPPGARGGRVGSGKPGIDLPLRTRRGIGSYKITGISRDVQGNVLPLCTVMLFATGSDVLVSKVVSEAVTGAFSFLVPDTTTRYYAVFYLAGTTDISGTTVNTLVGS